MSDAGSSNFPRQLICGDFDAERLIDSLTFQAFDVGAFHQLVEIRALCLPYSELTLHFKIVA